MNWRSGESRYRFLKIGMEWNEINGVIALMSQKKKMNFFFFLKNEMSISLRVRGEIKWKWKREKVCKASF